MVSPYTDIAFGGVSQVVPALVREASSLDLQIDWISTAPGKGKEWHSTSAFSHQKFFTRVSRNDFIWSVSLVFWFKENVRQYDLVHFHTLFSPMMTRLAMIAHRSSVPYWLTPHGMLDPWAIQHRGWKKGLYWNLFEKSAFKNAARIHVLHPGEAESVRRRGIKAPTVVISNGIERFDPLNKIQLELFWSRYPRTHGKKRILFLARIHPKKGLDSLIRALPYLLKKERDISLLVVGPNEGKTKEKLQKLAIKLRVADQIEWMGLLSGEKKKAVLQGSDCFVLPSHSEGLSHAILEAMAAGIPCAITQECSFDEVVKQQGAWRIERNPELMAETLNSILQDLPAARKQAQIGQDFVLKNHLWSEIGKKLRKAYGE